MSTVEQQLRRDVEEVARGVIVTEYDMQKARQEVQRRVDLRRKQVRRRTVAGAAAAALVIPALGYIAAHEIGGADRSAPPVRPGPTTPVDPDAGFLAGTPPTAALVDGLWRVDNDNLLVLFKEDGTMRFDNAGTLYSDPAVTGTYTIQGDTVAMNIRTGPAECIGERFVMRTSLSAVGEIHAVHSRPASAGCSPMLGERWVMQQVLPTYNNELAGLAFSSGGDWQTPADRDSLYGDWMAQVDDPLWPANTGGLVLEIAPTGSYVVGMHNLVVDRGRWRFDRSAARFVFVSSPRSLSCGAGDRVVLVGVEQLVSGTTAMRTNVKQNACGQDWPTHAWILLPHEED